jgi:anaerobic selenocysteine-containing dehydrogenase
MKVDRRSFLGLGLGAVAGIAVSPVGLKLMDDSSIWTQNWPWTPVPADGEVNYVNSVCSLCPGSCGITIRRIDKRPVKIEGNAEYPVNNGGACLHGISGLQYLYAPERVKTPLKKTGDKFQQISWEEAIGIVASKLARVKKSGPEKFACIADKSAGSVAGLFKMFTGTFGSDRFYTMPSLESYLELTAQKFHGKGKTLGFDLENSDFILSFGAGIIDGWGSPVHCFKANASRKERHAKLFQIEPVLSHTAANADRWIPVKPGTYADLALGMACVIIKNNLFDSTFTSGFTGGFSKLAAMVQKDYSPSRTAELTGVKPADIEKLATEFARAGKPVAVFGTGRGDGAQSLKELCAVHLLNCLVGNINKKGGVFVKPVPSYLNFPGSASDSEAMYASQLVDAVNAGSASGVEALMVYNANPCYELHDPENVKKAFKKIPFVVSISSFLDETAGQADIVLPAHTFVERFEDVPSGAGLVKTVVGLSKPAVDPVFDTKNPGEIVILIAKALKGKFAGRFAWENYEECLENLTGDIWDSLNGDGYAVLPYNTALESVSVDVSVLSGNPPTIRAQGNDDLTLIPVDNMRLIHSSVAASEFAIKTVSDKVLIKKDIVVKINPLTARGFKNGDCAIVKTPVGSARVKICLDEGIMPGVIGMDKGLGHGFDNRYVSHKGVNVNTLIAPVIESVSGLDAAFGIKARISKA